MERARRPVAYGAHDPLPLVFPEDRASIQLDLALVLEALNHQKIDTTMANTMNRLLHSCSLNLGKGPLVDAEAQDVVRRVILTPEGEEIAPPREVLEEGEAKPVHGVQCACRRCAEEHRGAEPEQHHRDCQCGLCEDSDQRSAVSDQRPIPGHTDVILSEVEEPAFLRPATIDGEPDEKSSSSVLNAERRSLNAAVKTASAKNLYEEQSKQTHKYSTLYQEIYGEYIEQHEAEYAAKAAAAMEAGIEPPPYEPFDPENIVTEASRKEKAWKEQIEKNKQIAGEIWVRRFGTPPPEPELTWNEKEDLRVAAMGAASGQ
jgi:hypothetical protein